MPVAETIMQWLNDSDAPMRVAQRDAQSGSDGAGGGRRHRLRPSVAADPRRGRLLRRAGRQAEAPGLVEGLRDALRGDNHAAYVNFLGRRGLARVHDATRQSTATAGAVKAQYDLGNLFRLNQNVVPARCPARPARG